MEDLIDGLSNDIEYKEIKPQVSLPITDCCRPLPQVIIYSSDPLSRCIEMAHHNVLVEFSFAFYQGFSASNFLAGHQTVGMSLWIKVVKITYAIIS